MYGWLAFHFEHQWRLLVSAVAAPIILLRSPESKALGVQWLGSYWKQNDQHWDDYSPTKKFLYLGIPFLITNLVIVWLASARLQTFLHRAHRVQRLHTALIVSIILLGYSVVLHLANHYYPAELAQFIPTWLIVWL